MPFIRSLVPQHFSTAQRQAVVDGVHQALIEAIDMPADELFHAVQPHGPDNYFYSRSFNGVARSDDAVVVEITLRRGRSDAMKRTLYARIAAELATRAQVAPADVFIFMHENDYSDWSVGHGRCAMALQQQVGAG